MKRLLLVVALITAALALAGCGGRISEFGFVDTQRIQTESTMIKEFNEQITAKIKEFQVLEEKEKTTLGEEDFSKNRQIRQAELMSMQKEMEAKFMTNLNTAMEEVMREKKLGAILVKGSVMTGGIDVTEDVLKRIK